MSRWILIAAAVAAVGALGCASSGRPANSAATAYPASEIPPVAHANQVPEVERLAPLPPKAVGSAAAPLDAIHPASYVSEAASITQPFLFGPDTSLGALIAFALGNNPEIQAIHMQAHALEARVPQVSAMDDPMLMTTAFLEPIQTAAGPQDVVLGISQKLPWFGKRALRGDVAYYEAEAMFARIASAELNVVEQVKVAYYDLYYLDQAIEVNQELQRRLGDVITIAKTKFETAREGTGLETVLQAQVELAELQTMLVQLEQAQEKAKARLIKALHAPPGVRLDLQPEIEPTNVPRSAELLVTLIDQCQPKLDATRLELDRDQAAIALAQRNHYPDVTLGFNWHAIGPTGLSAAATGDDAYAMLVGVNLPIYREKLNAGLREAQFKAARTARQYEALWDEVRAEVQTLHAEALEHDRVIQILRQEILTKAEQALDLSIDAYRFDRITFQQLIENYRSLLRYRLDYYRRLSQRQQSLARLERAVGCAISTWPVDVELIHPGRIESN